MPLWSSRAGEVVSRQMPMQMLRTGLLQPTNGEYSNGAARPLKLLSYNIQTGIDTRAYRHYVTGGWKHVLPHEGRTHNLRRIADIVVDYDFVACLLYTSDAADE